MDIVNTSEKEIWKIIRSVETGKHKYAVSHLGNIVNLTTNNIVSCKMKKEAKYTYKCLIVMILGQRRYFKVHRLVAEHFLSNPYGKTHIKFNSEDRTDCRIYNIKWANKSELMLSLTTGSNSLTGHRNISMRNNKFLVRKSYLGKSRSKQFATLEAAILWRDSFDIKKEMLKREDLIKNID